MNVKAKVSVIAFPGTEIISKNVSKELNACSVMPDIHRFPDGEIRVSVAPDKIGEKVIVVCSLDHPDRVILPLLFTVETLREFGAGEIILVAPYLAYMRQDKRFSEGEGISARYFARLLSAYLDVLITIDPHLHRIESLGDIFSIPSYVIHAAPAVADWIKNNVDKPLLIGPDSESEQWVKGLGQKSNIPFIVLEKTRHGDRKVEVTVPELEHWQDNTPVLFDDIISTGKTMLETATHLKKSGLKEPVCIGIHGVFSDNAYRDLLAAGIARVVTTNTIPHASNAIDMSFSISNELKRILHT